jgi:hypothetical protein
LTCPRCESPVSGNQRFCGQCGAALQTPCPPDFVDAEGEEAGGIGQVLDGRYRLTYLIGQGGMGSVYRAEVVGLGHTVAVKILHPGLSADAASRRRLENEARLAGQIDHPNIVSVLDFRSSPSLTYLVMEYLMGESLREVLHQVGHLGVQRTIHITRQLLSALEASHAINVLHRDLKPDNIYLIARQDSLDFVKVLDFGMALNRDPDRADRITSIGQVCGTPAYMSPEQVRGKELTARSDLYSVGVILYECLTGVNPFLANNTADTLVNHLTKVPELPSKLCKGAGIPPYLDALVMQALRKSQNERFESAAQFRKVLEALVLARRKTQEQAAITTCPECGKPLIVGALRCEACKQVLQKPGLGPEAIKEIVPPAMIEALDGEAGGAELQLSPTITSTTCPAIAWDPPLCGLQRELDQLRAFLHDRDRAPSRNLMRIIGRPGAGKGRLARELLKQSEAEGWATYYLEPEYQPFFPPLLPIQIMGARLLDGPAPLSDETELLSAAENAGFDMRHQLGLLEIFGMAPRSRDNADRKRARRAQAWRSMVHCAARRGPVLLVFPELQYLDAPSRELVSSLATGEPADSPLKIVVTEDPDLLMLWPETRSMTVAPLGSREAVTLASMLMERVDLKCDAEQVAEASGGIPLMLIELVRLASLDPYARLPRTLAEVINRRIGQLPPRARTLLHAMAVLGRPTTAENLFGLVASPQPENATLNLLTEQGFATVGESGWRPVHRVHRDVAYSSIPVAVRAIRNHAAARRPPGGGAPPPAASRRGSSTRIFLSCAQGSSISTSGTRVVLPAPGGATSTAALFTARAAVSPGNAASMGSCVSKVRIG